MSRKSSKHVVARQGGGWAVRSSGASRAGRVFKNKEDAVAYAKDVARKEHGELYVHKRDGTISDRVSYSSSYPGRVRGKETVSSGRDPQPPQDKKH